MFQSVKLSSEVLFCAVKVQNAIIQAKEVHKLRQAGLSSLHQDIWLELIQRSLSWTPPLVNQGLELCQIILGDETYIYINYIRPI